MTGSLSQTRGRPEPGRELDALIAEKVMGIAPEKWRFRCYVERHERDESWCYDCSALIGEAPADGRVPNRYSTDIAAAFAVVEKMREIGWHFDIGTHVDGWLATFTAKALRKFQRKPDGGASNSATAPHAICLAALAALSPADDGGAR